ncbi:stomatin [Tachysurus fulvidraco]|uniref:stomatin n=1 Tax=Tachysurus fulvidraco TaxID=1234273 RepID=UPI000F50D47E|nr:stomatin [Tachysurus fulvidraco]
MRMKNYRQVGHFCYLKTILNVFFTYKPTSPLNPFIPSLDVGRSKSLGFCGLLLTALSFLFILMTFPVSVWCCLKIVKEYERAVIFRLGRLLGGAKGPGIFWILPCVDTFRKVDLRTVSFNIPPQEVLTKDSVTIVVDAVVYYRVFNPTISITKVEDANVATQMLAQTTLRNMLGTKSLADILRDREEMAEQMEEVLYSASKNWGIKLERVELKDVKLPQTLQRAMAAEAEATREARAKVIAAEGEMKASCALKEAADVMSESPAALQLRYLQTLAEIATERNSTVVFPIPMDLITSFMKK